jgi:hypothetical protein
LHASLLNFGICNFGKLDATHISKNNLILTHACKPLLQPNLIHQARSLNKSKHQKKTKQQRTKRTKRTKITKTTTTTTKKK